MLLLRLVALALLPFYSTATPLLAYSSSGFPSLGLSDGFTHPPPPRLIAFKPPSDLCGTLVILSARGLEVDDFAWLPKRGSGIVEEREKAKEQVVEAEANEEEVVEWAKRWRAKCGKHLERSREWREIKVVLLESLDDPTGDRQAAVAALGKCSAPPGVCVATQELILFSPSDAEIKPYLNSIPSKPRVVILSSLSPAALTSIIALASTCETCSPPFNIIQVVPWIMIAGMFSYSFFLAHEEDAKKKKAMEETSRMAEEELVDLKRQQAQGDEETIGHEMPEGARRDGYVVLQAQQN